MHNKANTTPSKVAPLLLLLAPAVTSSVISADMVGRTEGAAVGLRVSITTLTEVASTVAPVDVATAEEKDGSASAVVTNEAAALTESNSATTSKVAVQIMPESSRLSAPLSL